MTLRPPRISLLALALLLAAAVLSACGNKEDVTTVAETEGIYVDLGPLTYQVQLSRALNAANVEDRAYLDGLPGDTPPLAADETWFAVWLRVENESDAPHRVASEFEIVDTLENVYRPVELAEANPFAYRAVTLKPGTLYPPRDSAAADGPIQGALLLFRIKLPSLENRPLEMKIKAPDAEGVVHLDV